PDEHVNKLMDAINWVATLAPIFAGCTDLFSQQSHKLGRYVDEILPVD
ncbi:MAG: hypothetical protein H0V70_01345, partial [Ktedonobacteraceae bacterium]|nr:hypothetical protein [Ktedonobacteraceae bacterium]